MTTQETKLFYSRSGGLCDSPNSLSLATADSTLEPVEHSHAPRSDFFHSLNSLDDPSDPMTQERETASMRIAHTASGNPTHDSDSGILEASDREADTPSRGLAAGFCFDADTVKCGESMDSDARATTTRVSANAQQIKDHLSHEPTLWQTLTSTYSLQRSNSAERDVVVASTALMGENVIDSPVERRTDGAARGRSDRLSKLPSAPNLSDGSASAAATHRLAVPSLATISKRSSSDTNTAATTANTAATTANTAAAHHSEANALSVGIMAQGLAWARRQRDRRQRQYLQHQAEQQLDKIRQAHALEQADHSTASTLLDNSTYQNLMHSSAKTSASRHTSDKTNIATESKVDVSLDVAVSTSGDGYSVALPMDLTTNREEDASWIPAVRVQDEVDTEPCPFLLSLSEMQQIAERVLPRGIAYCKWKRLYSLARDGDSFDACLRNVSSERQSLLVVRTSRNALFGGFADAPWGEGQVGFGASYYGGPQACLFRLDVTSVDVAVRVDVATSTALPDASDHTQVSGDENHCDSPSTRIVPNTTHRKLKCYHWTGANRYIQLCDVKHKMLAFGGGGKDGSFGLCVEQDFQLGSTGSCATFDNDPLCDQDSFDIVDLEIYGFLLGQF